MRGPDARFGGKTGRLGYDETSCGNQADAGAKATPVEPGCARDVAQRRLAMQVRDDLRDGRVRFRVDVAARAQDQPGVVNGVASQAPFGQQSDPVGNVDTARTDLLRDRPKRSRQILFDGAPPRLDRDENAGAVAQGLEEIERVPSCPTIGILVRESYAGDWVTTVS